MTHKRTTSTTGRRRFALPLRAADGFLLVETIVAMVVFAIVCTALVDMLTSSTSITTLSKQRTLAEQGVSNQIELIRGTDYDSVGTTTGNPGGSIPSSQTFAGVNGESLGVPATMTTKITYAGADVPGSAGTGADQKKVVVTITRTSDSEVLAQAVTYVAPKLQTSQTTGTVQATVTDMGSNQAQAGGTGDTLKDVKVTLTSPSGSTSSDTTDGGGMVTFAGLTPTSGVQTYGIGIATADLPSLYYAIPVSDFDLSPTQVLPESIQVYQPVTLYVTLQNPDGTPWPSTGSVSATITVNEDSSGTSWTFTNTFRAGDPAYEITTQGPGGAPLYPNHDYFVSVDATGFESATGDALVPATSVTYPATMASQLEGSITLTMTPVVMGTLDVTATRVRSGGGGATFACQSGASIEIDDSTGVAVTSGVTSKSSPYDVQLQVPAGATYTVKATGRNGRTGSTTIAATAGTTPVAVALNGSKASDSRC